MTDKIGRLIEAIGQQEAALEDLRKIIAKLPQLADGTPATPGLEVWTEYLGERWEARIVNVGETTIDIQYTNAANHRAKGCVSRLRDPNKWFPCFSFD